jgi:hypothetical protein
LAPSLGVEVSPVNVRDAGEIERAIHRNDACTPTISGTVCELRARQ